METDVLMLILQSVFTMLGALLMYTLNNFRKKFDELTKQIYMLKGSLDPMRDALERNTAQLNKTQSELQAIWRYIDAPPRPTDRRVSRS